MNLTSVLKALSLAIVIQISLGSTAFAQESSNDNSETETLEFNNPFNPKENAAVKIETRYVDAENATEELQKIIVETKNSVIVSSGDQQILQAASEAGSSVTLLPVDETTQKSKGILSWALNKMKTNVHRAYKKDKMGLAITTFVTGSNVITWINADQMSTFVKSTGILYITLTTLLLSVDKEAWIDAIKPFETRWRKILGVTENQKELSYVKKTGVAFLSVATLQTLLNSAFLPIIQPERIMNHTFNATDAALPLIVGVASTAAAFSWYEFFKGIDETTHPRARKMARILINTRQIILASVASTAMLIHSSQYGASPWIALTIGGVTGVPFFFKAQQITNWIENNLLIKKAFDSFQIMKDKVFPVKCENIFSPVSI